MRPSSTDIQQPSFRVANGTIEALKYLALLLMTLDHVNKFLFKAQVPYLFEVGRLAMPIFGFVLAYNLARPGALQNDLALRIVKRLLIFGGLASLFYTPMVGWLPLNILFTLLVATCTIFLIEQPGGWNKLFAFLVFLAGGIFVEFWWFALCYCLAAWWFCKGPCIARGMLWGLATLSLSAVNHNAWALAALPVIFLAPYINIGIPRLRHVFYAYYPAHLALLLAIRTFTP